MVKKLIVSLITLILPILIVFSFYRFLLGYGPLNSKAIVQLFGDTFQGTSNKLSYLLETLSNIYESAQVHAVLPVWKAPETNVAILDVLITLYNSLCYSLSFLVGLLLNISDIVRAVGGLLLMLVSDVISFLKILTILLIDSSPYVVDPYVPVG